MREEQLKLLFEYIDSAIEKAIARDHGRDYLYESIDKDKARQAAVNAICFDEFEELV